MGHAWNMVKVDGKYYHVDATWDDPVNYKDGEYVYESYYVNHDYFLCSDSQIKDSVRQHTVWTNNDL